METIKQLGGLANFELVAFQAENLDQAGRNILLSTISEMLEADPGDEQLRFSQAVLLEPVSYTHLTLPTNREV